MNSFSVTSPQASIFLWSFGCLTQAHLLTWQDAASGLDLCSSRGLGRSWDYTSSLFNSVSQVKRSSPVPAPRSLQPASLYALFILQKYCRVPPIARDVWARWLSLYFSWKRSEVIPVSSLEMPNPQIKDTGVKAFLVANMYNALASTFL